jgi:adenylylsulfate kinase
MIDERDDIEQRFVTVVPPEGQEQHGLTVWFTGLSAAGKTTICQSVYTELLTRGYRVEMLDADVIRKQLCPDLGFSKGDRDENVRRIGLLAQSLTRNGIIALVAAISPYRATRDEVRGQIRRFLEVHVDAPLHVCEERDPKGLYRRARAGDLQGFTGIDDPYEAPLAAEIRCATDQNTVNACRDQVVSAVLKYLS